MFCEPKIVLKHQQNQFCIYMRFNRCKSPNNLMSSNDLNYEIIDQFYGHYAALVWILYYCCKTQ
jgi:hypothetical protein